VRVFEVLLYLARVPGGLPMGEIAGDLILTSGGMTRLIDRMVAAGLVARRPSPPTTRTELGTVR
jgi:DNA-binding MarR family transcriptional regulator